MLQTATMEVVLSADITGSFASQNLIKLPCFLLHVSLDSSSSGRSFQDSALDPISHLPAFPSVHIITAKLEFLTFLENACYVVLHSPAFPHDLFFLPASPSLLLMGLLNLA